MKAAVLTALREIEIRNLPSPNITSPHEVLLRLKTVGVCGSDVHYYTTGRIGGQVVEYPFTVGHEAAAVVEQTGPAVRRVRTGDRVAIEPAVVCHQCDQCRAGRRNTCRNLRFLGCPGQLPGCLSEFIVMPEECCLPIPESMNFAAATLAEPLAIGMYAVKQSVNMDNARIGILGLGPIGLSVMLCARQAGAQKIYGADILDYRCRVAADHGADWVGNPEKVNLVEEVARREPLLLDAVFECCGQQKALDQAVRLLKPGGRLMIVGIPEFERYSFVADLARRREICLQHVRRQNQCAELAISMIAEQKINPEFMATDHYRLEQCQTAFRQVENYANGVIKAMIDFP